MESLSIELIFLETEEGNHDVGRFELFEAKVQKYGGSGRKRIHASCHVRTDVMT